MKVPNLFSLCILALLSVRASDSTAQWTEKEPTINLLEIDSTTIRWVRSQHLDSVEAIDTAGIVSLHARVSHRGDTEIVEVIQPYLGVLDTTYTFFVGEEIVPRYVVTVSYPLNPTLRKLSNLSGGPWHPDTTIRWYDSKGRTVKQVTQSGLKTQIETTFYHDSANVTFTDGPHETSYQYFNRYGKPDSIIDLTYSIRMRTLYNYDALGREVVKVDLVDTINMETDSTRYDASGARTVRIYKIQDSTRSLGLSKIEKYDRSGYLLDVKDFQRSTEPPVDALAKVLETKILYRVGRHGELLETKRVLRGRVLQHSTYRYFYHAS